MKENKMENNTQQHSTKPAYELADNVKSDISVSVSSSNSKPPKHKKSKSLLKRLEKGVKTGKKIWIMTKIGLATAIGVGGGAYVYKQFHKSPQVVQQETEQMKEEVRQEVQEMFQKEAEEPSTVGKAAGKIAETGVSHGGAVRKWIIEKWQDKNK